MAEETPTPLSTLHATSHISIAQLTPLLAAPASRSLKAVVTLTWPYSSAKKTVAFLLAEPDFRLRRTRGQVRVQFSGSSAKAVAESGIASGDTINLSLDGVDFVHDDNPISTPGRGVEFELRFTEKLLLEFQQEGGQNASLLYVDHPPVEEEQSNVANSKDTSVDEYGTTHPTANGTPRRAGNLLADDEFASPAFVKRARTSFGSLWGDDYSLDDGTVKGKGRKRTRLSSNWVVASRSPTPEVEEIIQTEGVSVSPAAIQVADQNLTMMDEGVQTDDIENSIPETLLALARGSMANFNQDQGLSAAINDNLSTGITGEHASAIDEGAAHHSPQVIEQTNSSSSPLKLLPTETFPQPSPFPESSMVSDEPHASTGTALENRVDTEVDDSSFVDSHAEVGFESGIYNARPLHSLPSDSKPLYPNISEHVEIPYEPPQVQAVDEQHVEDQYGSWQSVNAQPVQQHVYPQGEISLENPKENFGWSVQDDFNPQDGPSPTLDAEPTQEYPDPDEVLSNSRVTSGWQSHSIAKSYPELEEEHGDNLDSLVRSLEQAQSQATSRPESAHSAVIDLVESDDDLEEEEEELDVMSSPQALTKHELQEEYSDEDGGYEDDVEAEFQENPSLRPSKAEKLVGLEGTRSETSMQEESDNEEDYSEEEEGEEDEQEMYDEDDDDLDAQGNPYPPGFHKHGEQDDYDEEEQEEEDELDDEEESDSAPPAQLKQSHEPVTISLLSSDDDQDEEEEGEEDEEDEEEEDEEDEDGADKQVEIQNSKQNIIVSSAEIDEDSDEESGVDEQLENDDSENESAEAQNPDVDLASHSVDDEMSEQLANKESVETDALYNLKDDSLSQREGHSSMSIANEVQDKHTQIYTLEFGKTEEGEEVLLSQENANVEEMQVDAQTIETLSSIAQTGPELSTRMEKIQSLGFDGTNDSFEVPQDLPRQSPPASIFSNIAQISRSMAFKSSPPRTSLFSRVFSIDGANDLPEDSITYPSLPPQSPPAIIADSAVTRSLEPRSMRTDEQLPTPENTQVRDDFDTRDQAGGLQDQHANAEADVETELNDNTESKHVISNTKEDTDASPLSPQLEQPETGNVENELGGNVAVASTVDDLGSVTSLTKEDNSIVRLETPERQTSPAAEFTTDSPRRSHRRTKSTPKALTSKQAESANTQKTSISQAENEGVALLPGKQNTTFVQENLDLAPKISTLPIASLKVPVLEEAPPLAAPTTPVRRKHVKKDSVDKGQQSPAVIVDIPATPKGHDASIELALSSLNSPEHDLRRTPILDLKLRLNRNLRTELEDFKSLKILRYELNKKLDVLAIATSAPPTPERAKNGPRHYLITFNVTDPSIAPTGVAEVQILRPYKEALPTINIGDGILLRNFSVIALKNKGFGLRSDAESASWAVFKNGDNVEVRGPPVEFGAAERNHMTQMKVWYENLDDQSVAKLRRANGDRGAS